MDCRSILKRYSEEYTNLFRLGLPVLVTQLGVIMVSFADTMMVGAYGVDELAASAFVNSLFVIPIVMQIGFAQGLTPLIGALFGKERRGVRDNTETKSIKDVQDETGATLRAGVQINVAVSVVISVIMCILYFFLDWFGQPTELLPLIKEYYLIILASVLPLSIFNTFQQTCNGLNDTAMPMWMMLGSNVLNIFGNWVLIFGHLGSPEMGLAGAGISTLIARYASALAIVVIFFSSGRYRPYISGFRSKKSLGMIRRNVWFTSYPVMIQSGVECLLWSVGAVVSGWFGKIQLAAYQVVNTMSQLGFMTYISFGTAASIRIANHTGRKDWQGVTRTSTAGLHLILLLSTLSSAIFLFGGKWIISCFTPDTRVIAVALTLIAPLVIYQYMDAIQLTYCNAIRGTSQVKSLLWIAVTTYILIGLPVLLLFAKTFNGGTVGVYYSFNVVLFVAALFYTTTFYRIVKKEKNED